MARTATFLSSVNSRRSVGRFRRGSKGEPDGVILNDLERFMGLPACARSCRRGLLVAQKAASRLPLLYGLPGGASRCGLRSCSGLQLASDHFYHRYWYALNWAASVVGLSLGFKVLHEIFMDVFRPYHAMKDPGHGAVSLGSARDAAGGSGSGGVGQNGYPSRDGAGRGRSPALCSSGADGLGVVPIELGFTLGNSLAPPQFRLGGWFRILRYSGVADLRRAPKWPGIRLRQGAATLANMMAYNLSVMIWFAYCWISSPATVSESGRLKTHRWDRSLGEIQNPEPAESLIPMFEDMVERALARSSTGGLADFCSARQAHQRRQVVSA